MENRSKYYLPVIAAMVLMLLSGTTMAANNSTGNRIWDADENMSLEYTWTALSYSGFYFDLDSGEGSETLTISLDSDSDRNIGDGDLEYSTTPIDTDFEQGDWGSYQVIGFMAERYFAGYTDDTEFADDDVSLISDGILTKVLQDDDEEISFYSGSSLVLEEGYELNLEEVDVNGNSVLVTLEKDGDQVDTDIVSSDDDYIYEIELGEEDVPIIVVHFNNIFQGTETNAVFVEGIFQISEDYIEIEAGDTFGKMEVDALGSDMITMENSDSISLGRGDSVTIMGKLKFIVADDNTLRFGPIVDMSDPGTYELRGTVAEDEELEWTPLNFEGFYYNIDEGVGTESLEVKDLSGRTIDDGDLVYRSVPLDVSFEHDDWGEFQVIGFMAEKYFAGYPDNEFTDDVSLLSDGQLSEVLIDEDSKRSLYSGSSLVLEDGYELYVVEVDLDGSSVMVNLVKDGDDVDTGIVSSDDDYVYEKDMGSTDDVPIIVVHFDEIFQGTETNAVFVEGIFQISEDVVEISDDEKFGEMEVKSFDSDQIVLENEDSISLSRGKIIEIMGDIAFNVADDGDVRYYPFVEVSTVPSQSLSIDVNSVIEEDEKVEITVTSRGAAVEDALVMFGDEEVGETSTEGIVTFRPGSAGTFTVTAEKEGYVSASEKVEVVSSDDASRTLVIEVAPDTVVEEDTITITVMTAIGGDLVEDAQVYYDSKDIGTTNANGMVTYTVKETGLHKLTSSADGYLEAELNLEVLALEAKFTYSNLQASPILVKTGEEVTITVNVANTGTAEGDKDVDLKINGTVVDTQSVTLDAGEETNLAFTVSQEEAGTYEAQVGDATVTFDVEKSSIPGPGIIVSMVALVAVAMLIRRNERKD
ncbi:S-layer protein domain-containing protein [Methanolobus profundi]|uniref:S-layer family duplication domain-containing protein n=1 Tax=Methanolobus profundi TaxID=487685 RepID=A0A1I4RZS3_9EURY|nr:S-layer protein domain-containing protein [Methanolobus profundi]SFM57709.1 S-layer family duplication domain-containing protein [Methanolobus profundi]